MMKSTFFALLVAILMMGCMPSSASSTTVVNVFAAASLRDAFDELANEYEARHSNVEIRLNVAGSSQLAAQINAGAPADVFASANLQQMENVASNRGLQDNPVAFASNALVVIVPRNNPANIMNINDLANSNVMFVTSTPGVPIRDYTNTVLQALNEPFGDAFAANVRRNFVSEESNVRQVAVKVALGEADAGIVYRSDVTTDIAEQVTVLPIPPDYNVTAQYYIAPISNDDSAQDFIDFVLNSETTLQKWGFESVD